MTRHQESVSRKVGPRPLALPSVAWDNGITARQAAAGVQAEVQATQTKPAFSARGRAAYTLG
jgi:hypothetical protein